MTPPADVCVTEHRLDPDRPRIAVDGAWLCRGCITQLRNHLAALPQRYADLEAILARGTVAAGQRVSGTTERWLPISPAVAEHRHQIAHDLVWWCVYVADERGIARPDSTEPATTAAWLARHVDWCAARRPAAEELLPVLRHLVGRAWALIDPRGSRRITIGPCITTDGDEPCEGTLYATVRAEDDPRPSAIYCEACGLDKPPAEWLRFGRTYVRATAGTDGVAG